MIKVLVVDDSAFMRKIISEIISSDSQLQVADTARNGNDALKKLEKIVPDVITLDIEMPEKDGLETLKVLKKTEFKEIPVIMLSALDNSQTVLEALEIGAFDFISKPSGTISLDIKKIGQDLCLKIKAAVKSENRDMVIKKEANNESGLRNKIRSGFPVIAVGCSSGGPRALKKFFASLSADFPGGIIVVQHMPAGFTEAFARRLNESSEIEIKEAVKGDIINPGKALIAPGDYHLELDDQERVVLHKKPRKWGVRPCVDYMMNSAARLYKERVIGVILTGMGQDGAVGMKRIKENNGYGIVEDRSTALVYGMPGAVIAVNAYDKIVPMSKIQQEIIDVIERRF